MVKATFKKSGGRIFAEIKSGYAQPGSYSLFLWEAESNNIVMKKHGNFINTKDDKYAMPRPNETNDHRIVDVFATLVLTPPMADYRVELEITQDGKVIGKDLQEGKSSERTQTMKLFVLLAGKE